MNSQTYSNFGGNRVFTPATVWTPRNEDELLELMRTCRGRRIRAIGRLHSWSEAPIADDVLVDLRHFQDVRTDRRGDRNWVTVGAGCQIKRVLSELERQSGGTLPSVGLITEQTIAGAISTGTHGSGRPSMSHFMDEIRVATYDAAGGPMIRTITNGDELRAARCSLGAMGIVVSVGFWSRPSYMVEEHFSRYDDLESVLAKEDEFPLQQFYLMPWWWRYLAQHRRIAERPRGGWAALYRLYVFLQFDVGLHLLVRFAARTLRSPHLVRLLFRKVAPLLVIRNWRVVDDSNKMLVMKHELFQHIECELFVRRSKLTVAIELVVQLLKYAGGERDALTPGARLHLQQAAAFDEVEALCGEYTHHYPICIRRVLPDDTLISMSSGGDESCYALSFISYVRPTDREGFLKFTACLSGILASQFDARPHWGKLCALPPAEAERLYPKLPRFREICLTADPAGAFRNDWVSRTLFADKPATTPALHP